VVQRLQIAFDRLEIRDRGSALPGALDGLLMQQVRCAPSELRSAWLDGLIALAGGPEGLQTLERLALSRTRRGSAVPVHLRSRAAMMLVVRGAWQSAQALKALEPADRNPARLPLAAARPDARSKSEVFARLLADTRLSDESILQALDALVHCAHARLTLPLLAPALRAVPQLQHRRKIFFVNRWIGAFVGGQNGERARSILARAIARHAADEPIRRKLLEADCELGIAIEIRRRWLRERRRTERAR
jgi:hypothetical protein